jgi:hypothetical protein
VFLFHSRHLLGCMNGVRRELDMVLWLRICTALTLSVYLLVLVVPSLGQNSAAGLPWSGQAICQLNLQQDGYTHQETQTWTITGTGPRTDSNIPMYDATWSFSGKGAAQRTRGPQTITAAWTRAGAPVNAPLAILVRASDGRLLIKSSHSQLRAAGATTGLQSTVTAGAQPSQTMISSDVYEWPFPVIEVAGDSVDVTGTGTVVVTGGLLPLQMASTIGTATCQWHFARGGSAPASVMNTPDVAVLNPALPAAGAPSPGSVGGTTAPGSGAAPSGSTGPAAAGSAAAGSATGSCSTSAGSGAPQAIATPKALIGPGSVKLTWTGPAGGGAVDFYQVESQPAGSGTATQQTVKAPATSVTLKLNACPYPASSCSGAGGYTFRVRAHNGAGCGPYSSSTANVRPLVSYLADNVAEIWTAGKCVQCHTGPSTTLDLSGPAAESYNRVGLYSARNPANRNRLLACPTGGSCSTPQNSVHPGGQGFSTSSKEYLLLLQWIQDGFRN